MASKFKGTNAQDIMKSDMTSQAMRKNLVSAQKEAKKRMDALKKAGCEFTDFYQNHKTDFREVPFGRENMAKELARTNQFLQAKQSRVKGMKQASSELLELYNVNFFGYIKGDSPESDPHLTEKSLPRFQSFMRYYKENIKKQTNIQSDVVVEAFLLAEKLHISHKDMLNNIDLFADYQKQLESMELKDMFPDGKVDNRYRFKLGDYMDAFIDKQMYR